MCVCLTSLYLDIFQDSKQEEDEDFNENSHIFNNTTIVASTSEPTESTSPYARANMQLPKKPSKKRRRPWHQVIKEAFGSTQTISGIPGENGARIIHINNATLNHQQNFLHNGITTGKYSVLSFLPRFLYEEFSKYANLFFLFISCIQVNDASSFFF
jgi:phospholipid-transporting ATPase